MEAQLQEWLNLCVRLIHVIAGIMWIGDSFLFMFLDKSLVPPKHPLQGDVLGEMHMTHGGGFYQLIKRKSLTKDELPPTLHWFMWESYTTWMSGFTLLVVVYYMGDAALLIDPQVLQVTPWQGIGLSVALLVAGWLVYDRLCEWLGSKTLLLALVCAALVVGAGFGLLQVFSPRGAFIHVGALMATCMSGNVFFRIIPGQKKLLAAAMAGLPPDVSFGIKAKTRSTHNHYITLPVVLTMISNHFPSLYGHSQAWLVLACLLVFGGGIKYLMNFKGQSHPGLIAATLLSLATIMVLTAPVSDASAEKYAVGPEVPFARAWAIVQTRCSSCHAQKPANPSFPQAPNGIALDTAEAVKRHAARIFARSVSNRTMPLGNQTGMTDAERAELGAWYAKGAKLGDFDGSLAPTAAATGLVHYASPQDEAKALYVQRCVACHGVAGAGDGPAAAGLPVKPRDFRDSSWQKGVSDAELVKVIVQGGPAAGKNAAMPPNPDLQAKVEVTAALIGHLRSLAALAPTAPSPLQRTSVPAEPASAPAQPAPAPADATSAL